MRRLFIEEMESCLLAGCQNRGGHGIIQSVLRWGAKIGIKPRSSEYITEDTEEQLNSCANLFHNERSRNLPRKLNIPTYRPNKREMTTAHREESYIELERRSRAPKME